MRISNSLASLFVIALVVNGCATDIGDASDDKAGDDGVGGTGGEPEGDVENAEELWDEGPLAADDRPTPFDSLDDAADKAGLFTVDESDAVGEALAAAPRFQLPFPCNQTWSGQTRTNHSPLAAIDFNRAGDEGDAVLAAASGSVSVVANLGNRSYGRWIEINHGGGWTTRYAHLSSQAVRVGQKVARGQRIGAVGNSGGSSGAHLHYEVRRGGVPVRVAFNGAGALYYGTRSYKSSNACGGGGGGGGAAPSGGTGRVDTSGPALTVRSGPGTGYAAIGSVRDGASVTIRCQKLGQRVTGKFGTTALWDKVGAGYISDAYVYTGSDGRVAPTCP